MEDQTEENDSYSRRIGRKNELTESDLEYESIVEDM